MGDLVPLEDGFAGTERLFRVFEHVVGDRVHLVVDSWEFHEALGASETKHRRWIKSRFAQNSAAQIDVWPVEPGDVDRLEEFRPFLPGTPGDGSELVEYSAKNGRNPLMPQAWSRPAQEAVSAVPVDGSDVRHDG